MPGWLRPASIAFTWLFTACGGETGPGGDGFALESARAVTRTIGAEGASLTTTDAGGRTYTLIIPPLALADSVAITLTPVASFPALPGGGELLAGADFAPEGLAFARPATLRIRGPQLSGRPSGFTYSGAGVAVQPAIAGSGADEFVALVTHFSGVGLIAETLGLEPDGPTPGEVQAFVEVNSIATATDWPAGNWDNAYDGIVQGLERWYRDYVGPALAGADNDQELTNALGGYSAWLHVIDCGASSCPSDVGNLHLWPEGIGGLLRQSLAAALTDAAAEAREAVEQGIERTIEQCREDRDLAAGAQSLYWARVAVLLGAETPEDPLGECVALELYELAFPDQLAAGVPAELRLIAGLSFSGEPSTFDRYLEVHIEASDALPSVAGGNTAVGTGEFTMDFTPDGDAPVVLGIRINWGQNGLQDVLKLDTLIERNLGISVIVTPAAAILDPGAEAQFTATVEGSANPAVTWSATGGSFSPAGNTVTYVAGSTPGTYAVTATSVADPARSATATITIGGEPIGAIVILDRDGDLRLETEDPGGNPCTIEFSPDRPVPLASGEKVCAEPSLDARGEWRMATTSAAPTEMTISAELDLSSQAPSEAYGFSGGSLAIDFEVRDGPVHFEISGVAVVSTSGGTTAEAEAQVQLEGNELEGDAFEIEVTSGSAPLQGSGTLPPGRYRLFLFGRVELFKSGSAQRHGAVAIGSTITLRVE